MDLGLNQNKNFKYFKNDAIYYTAMNNIKVIAFVLCQFLLNAVFFLPQVHSSSPTLSNETQRPKIALVLSGGGALGYAHIGVLKVLEELRVPVDCVVGTSMGALVGGAYAAGVSPERMQKVITETDIGALFDDDPPRSEITQSIKRDDYKPLFDLSFGFNDGNVQLPFGTSAGYKFELFLKELIGLRSSMSNMNFDDLPISYRAIATDLETGDIMVFDHGDLPKAMRASMSLPGIVSPIEIDDRLYVDGGLVNNLPIDVGRRLCGEIIIAVNLGTKPKTREEIKNSFDVAMQSIVLLTEQNVKASLAKLTADDILIVPDLDEFDSSSFSKPQQIIERGVAAANANKDKLSKLAISPVEYQRWLATRQPEQTPPLKIKEIDVEKKEGMDAKAVQGDIETSAGQNFDMKLLHKDITKIYGRGDFSYVGYSVIPVEDGSEIVIEADRKPWGPGYVKFGLGVAMDFSSPTQFNLATSYRRTWINSLGAEWRTDAQIGYDSFINTEFIQPLQIRGGVFISPYFFARRNSLQVYRERDRLGDIDIQRLQLGLDVGITGSAGEMRIGTYANYIYERPDLGVLNLFQSISDTTVYQKGFSFSGIYDQLDSSVFPRSGVYAKAEIRNAYQSGDLSEYYTRGQLSIAGAISFGENTLAGHIEWGEILGGVENLADYDNFELGGPNRLSGLYLDQLTGTRYNLATVRYYRRFASLPPQFGRGLYFGASLESGRINDPLMEDPWGWVEAGSIYVGADTIFGVLYLGYGYASLGQGTFYLEIGPQF
jgi:NTE family protein